MKIKIGLILIAFYSFVYQVSFASDFQIDLYPSTTQVVVSAISNADTVTVTIENHLLQDVLNFHLTANSDDSVLLVETIIDGTSVSAIEVEVFDGLIYPNQLSTTFLLGDFGQSIQLKFYTPNSDNSSITFFGEEANTFFGIAEPIVVVTNCCLGIRGNANNDPQDATDISDLIYIVDFIFTDGPTPVCMDEANLDGIGDVDISDLVFIINFIFTNDGTVQPADCP